MIIIVGLMGLGILLDVMFVIGMWPPWRSESPQLAWLLVMLASVGSTYELFILLATLHIPPPGLPVLLVLFAKDAILGWRLRELLRIRRAVKEKIPSEEER